MRSRLATVAELLGFMLRGSRKFWLLPLVLSLLIVIVLIAFAAASSVAPFLYPFF
jgi:hypothetical protein